MRLRQAAVVNHAHSDEHVRTHIRSRSLRRSSGDTIKSQGGSSVSSSARLCLAPSLPVLGHVSREIIIQLLNEDRNTALNVSFSPSLLTALFQSILNFFFLWPLHFSLISFFQSNLRLIVRHSSFTPFASSPIHPSHFHSLHHLIACRGDLLFLALVVEKCRKCFKGTIFIVNAKERDMESKRERTRVSDEFGSTREVWMQIE